MKSTFKIFLCFLFLLLYVSCSDEQADESLKPPEIQTEHIQKRNPNNDPFYDQLHVYDLLNIESQRLGTYPFVSDVMATLQNMATGDSFYENLRAENIFPCWHCAEPEIFDFPNYYIPFYELSTSRLDGLLIAQEKNNEKKFYYLSKSVVDQIVAVRFEAYSQYWNRIMNFFNLDTYPDGREDVFASSLNPCLWFESASGPVCGCPEITAQGQLSYGFCHMKDQINNPDCDKGSCPNLSGDGGGGLEDIDVFDMGDWTSLDDDNGGSSTTGGNNNSGGSNNNNNNEPKPDWEDNCDSYDGSLSAGVILEDGGEIVIDESTGTIAIDALEKLYEMQVSDFISDFGLPYTAKELIELLGEKCAVSDVKQVRNCIKCYFISPLGLPSNISWDLAEDFNIYMDCESDPNPDCVECKLALKSMNLPNGNALSNSEKAAIENNLDCSNFDCLNDNPALLETVLGFLEIYNSFSNNPNSEDINEVLNNMDGCSPASFMEELNAHFNITSKPSQQNTFPTLNIGSTLCAGIFDIQDVGDGIHSVGAISGLRFDVVNSNGQLQTLNFDHVVILLDNNINNPNCPGSTVANLMAQAVNETIAFIRGQMGNALNYNQILSPNTFIEVLNNILGQKSASCVAHGNGGSAGAITTNNPAAESAFSNAVFVQLANNHISNQNGVDCQ